MEDYEPKYMRGVLQDLTQSASHYIEDSVWFASLVIDLRRAASLLGDNKLLEKMNDWLGEEDEEEEDEEEDE